ncbi:MAG: hypothetical protein NE327_13460 [Lentisphaeraceae bacterium]|nr:hypothetical protein [Lentisphaeraceae bacterium]
MKNILHILCASLITLTAIIPSGLVLCEKDGRIAIEFESGEACSCDVQGKDMADKFCCDDIQCHEDETVTSLCHEEKQLSANDCSDTKIEAFDALKYFSNSIKAPVKTLKISTFFEQAELLSKVTYGLNAAMDFGEPEKLSEIVNQPLTLKKTSVFII